MLANGRDVPFGDTNVMFLVARFNGANGVPCAEHPLKRLGSTGPLLVHHPLVPPPAVVPPLLVDPGVVAPAPAEPHAEPAVLHPAVLDELPADHPCH